MPVIHQERGDFEALVLEYRSLFYVMSDHGQAFLRPHFFVAAHVKVKRKGPLHVLHHVASTSWAPHFEWHSAPIRPRRRCKKEIRQVDGVVRVQMRDGPAPEPTTMTFKLVSLRD
jgi:hypothetical protein